MPRTAKALGIAQVKPVCRFIESALKACGIDEGFYQQQGMVKVHLPIAGQSLSALKKSAAYTKSRRLSGGD
jgi:hypothetical protein